MKKYLKQGITFLLKTTFTHFTLLAKVSNCKSQPISSLQIRGMKVMLDYFNYTFMT